MKLFKIIIIFFIIFSCKTKSQENAKIISPNENLKYGNSLKYILENSTNSNELSTDIIANLSVKNLKFISTNDKIYVIDSLTKKIQKTFNFNFTELKLELLSVEFNANKNKTKVLVTTSSGQSSTSLIFQIDISSLKIDWLTEYSKQIETSSYSHNLKTIALGTSYNQKNKNSNEYYSSLFLLNSETGKFLNYFEQGESVSQIKFSDDNNLMFAVLDWPHTDTFVWNLKSREKKLGAFGKDNISFYNIIDIDENYFITIGSDGIYKWNKTDTKNYKIVYKATINGSDKIYKFENIFILIDYLNGSANPPIIKYFDSKFKLTDSKKINTTFNNTTSSAYKLEGIGDNNKLLCFDIKKKNITETFELNEILEMEK